jgi:hypothetical protein
MLTTQELLEKLGKEFPALSFKDPNSSNIWLYAYSKGEKNLYVIFKQAKFPVKVYQYQHVSEPIFKLFEKAKSKGIFFSQNIKGKPSFPYGICKLIS